MPPVRRILQDLMRLRFFLPLAALAVLTACAGDADSSPAPAASAAETPAAEPRPGAVVDSAIPMPEALRRFQAAIEEPAPERLQGGATTLEELFRRLVAAYAARDAAALDRLAVTRAEFGYLYYPESPYSEPPYELAPDFVWFLVEERGVRAVSRATERLAEKGPTMTSYSCPGAVKDEGTNRLWGPCFVRVRFADGSEDELRLANAIMEREGRFKLVGFDNGL
jgi:hypothetical protein